MTIENFFTWEMLATFAGCTAATGIVTELIKKYLKKLDPQIISFLVAMLILVVGQLVSGAFTWNGILLNAINAVVISFTANGGFDAIKRAFTETTYDDEIAGTIILDKNEPGNSYISFKDNPEGLVNGELLKLNVKTVNTEK